MLKICILALMVIICSCVKEKENALVADVVIDGKGFEVSYGNEAEIAQQKENEKSCLKDPGSCMTLAMKLYESKELDQAFVYFSILCDHLEGNELICAGLAELGSRDLKYAPKARAILKKWCDVKFNICPFQAIVEEKLGNISVADALYHKGCADVYSCIQTIRFLSIDNTEKNNKKAAVLLRTCMANGGHPSCLENVALREDDCIEAEKLLVQACAYSKIDPNACKKMEKIIVQVDSPEGAKLILACNIHQSAESACVTLKSHKEFHGQHKELGKSCAGGSDQACNHMSKYFEISEPDKAKNIKCGFGEWSGCRDLWIEEVASSCYKKLTVEERDREDKIYPGRRNISRDYSSMGEFEASDCAGLRQVLGLNCTEGKSEKSCLIFSKLTEIHRPDLAKKFKCGFGVISGCNGIFK